MFKTTVTPKGNLTVYALGHYDGHFDKIKKRDYIQFVDLRTLDVGEFQRNDFGEDRFFYSGFEEGLVTEYVGLGTASWNQKYFNMHMIDFLHRLHLEPNVVWAPGIPKKEWKRFSVYAHPGMEVYLKKLDEITGIPTGRSIWSNNFICHKDILLNFLKFFRETWFQLNQIYNWEYNFDTLDIDVNARWKGVPRNPAYMAERVAMYYWASRTDLELKQITSE